MLLMMEMMDEDDENDEDDEDDDDVNEDDGGRTTTTTMMMMLQTTSETSVMNCCKADCSSLPLLLLFILKFPDANKLDLLELCFDDMMTEVIHSITSDQSAFYGPAWSFVMRRRWIA